MNAESATPEYLWDVHRVNRVRNGSSLEPELNAPPKLLYVITPEQLDWCLANLSVHAMRVLIRIVSHGYREGERYEVSGFSTRWLMEQGMTKTSAEKGAKELEEKGYIRREDIREGVRFAGQLVILQGGLLNEGNDPVGPAYRKGGVRRSSQGDEPKTHSGDAEVVRTDDVRPVDNTSVRASVVRRSADEHPVDNSDIVVSVNHRNDDGHPVDNPAPFVSAVHRNEGGGERDRAEAYPANMQVRTVSVDGSNVPSTPPTSKVSEEEVFSLLLGGLPVTHTSVHSFLVHPPVRLAAQTNYEATASALSSVLEPRSTECGRLMSWLGRTGQYPHAALAAMCADWLRRDPAEQFTSAQVLTEELNARNVRFTGRTPSLLLTGFIFTALVAIDANVKSYPGWFGGGLKPTTTFTAQQTLTSFLKEIKEISAKGLSGLWIPPIVPVTARRTGDEPIGSQPERAVPPLVGPGWTIESDQVNHIMKRHCLTRGEVQQILQAAISIGSPFVTDAVVFQMLMKNTKQKTYLLARARQMGVVA